MRKVVAILTSTVVMVSIALAGCTVKVQSKKAEDPPPKAEKKADPPPKKKKVKIKLRPARKVKHEIELPEPVPFTSGSAILDMDAGAGEVLGLVKDYMDQNPDVTLLRVEGHTDSDGDDASNLQLSKDRTASVVAWLVTNGVACKRLIPVGFGEEKPIAANDTADNKAKNRRVSFFDATVNNKPVADDNKKPIPVDNGGKLALDPCNPSIKK